MVFRVQLAYFFIETICCSQNGSIQFLHTITILEDIIYRRGKDTPVFEQISILPSMHHKRGRKSISFLSFFLFHLEAVNNFLLLTKASPNRVKCESLLYRFDN